MELLGLTIKKTNPEGEDILRTTTKGTTFTWNAQVPGFCVREQHVDFTVLDSQGNDVVVPLSAGARCIFSNGPDMVEVEVVTFPAL